MNPGLALADMAEQARLFELEMKRGKNATSRTDGPGRSNNQGVDQGEKRGRSSGESQRKEQASQMPGFFSNYNAVNETGNLDILNAPLEADRERPPEEEIISTQEPLDATVAESPDAPHTKQSREGYERQGPPMDAHFANAMNHRSGMGDQPTLSETFSSNGFLEFKKQQEQEQEMLRRRKLVEDRSHMERQLLSQQQRMTAQATQNRHMNTLQGMSTHSADGLLSGRELLRDPVQRQGRAGAAMDPRAAGLQQPRQPGEKNRGYDLDELLNLKSMDRGNYAGLPRRPQQGELRSRSRQEQAMLLQQQQQQQQRISGQHGQRPLQPGLAENFLRTGSAQQGHLSQKPRPNVQLRLVPGMWYYQDPQGNAQGPFSSDQMRGWLERGFFDSTLMVTRHAPHNMYMPLKKYFRDPSKAFLEEVPLPGVAHESSGHARASHNLRIRQQGAPAYPQARPESVPKSNIEEMFSASRQPGHRHPSELTPGNFGSMSKDSRLQERFSDMHSFSANEVSQPELGSVFKRSEGGGQRKSLASRVSAAGDTGGLGSVDASDFDHFKMEEIMRNQRQRGKGSDAQHDPTTHQEYREAEAGARKYGREDSASLKATATGAPESKDIFKKLSMKPSQESLGQVSAWKDTRQSHQEHTKPAVAKSSEAGAVVENPWKTNVGVKMEAGSAVQHTEAAQKEADSGFLSQDEVSKVGTQKLAGLCNDLKKILGVSGGQSKQGKQAKQSTKSGGKAEGSKDSRSQSKQGGGRDSDKSESQEKRGKKSQPQRKVADLGNEMQASAPKPTTAAVAANPWKKPSAKVTSNAVSLREIQEEEQRKVKQNMMNGTYKQQQKKVWANLVAKNSGLVQQPGVPGASQNASRLGPNSMQGAGGKTGFMTNPNQPVSGTMTKKEKRNAELQAKQNDLLSWCENQSKALKLGKLKGGGLDLPPFFLFCMNLDTASDVREYFRDNLGSTPEISKFATEFINKKQHLFSSGSSMTSAGSQGRSHASQRGNQGFVTVGANRKGKK